jgi:hypothetical protein
LFDKVMPLYVWPRIIIIGSKWMWVVRFMSQLLFPRKNPEWPLNWRTSRPQSHFGCVGEKINLHPLPGIESWMVQIQCSSTMYH